MRILVCDPIAEDGIALLRQAGDVEVRTGLKPEELIALVGDFEALVVRSETRLTAEVIEAGSKLRVIGRAGVGVDNIDLEAATRRGIVVVNAPTGNVIAAAEHTIAMMLALARHIPQAMISLKSGRWERSKFIGVEVRDKTLGIIGMGKIGAEVARRAIGLGMRVIAHDPFINAEHARNQGVELLPFDDVLRTADFISLHTPLTPQTRGMIGLQQLALMKPTARIINVARGGLIDEAALCEAIERGWIAGAAIDVFSEEPAVDNPLIHCDKIIVTPHLGASTEEAQVTVAVDVAQQIIDVLHDRPARYAVNAPLVPPETLQTLKPFMDLVEKLAELATQLAEGQAESVQITYSGEIANEATQPLKAALVRGLLAQVSEETVNMVNAELIARSRGLKIVEVKDTRSESYESLITIELRASSRPAIVAGTVIRGEPQIVRIDNYWLQIAPSGSHFMLCWNHDRPGLIGAVGTLLGKHDINISAMLVGRDRPRGTALMALAVDEEIPERQLAEIAAIPDVYAVKQVRL